MQYYDLCSCRRTRSRNGSRRRKRSLKSWNDYVYDCFFYNDDARCGTRLKNLGVETLILGKRRQGAIQAIAASRPAL